MGHLHTRLGEHDLTVSMYIVRLSHLQPALMLHKHKKLGRYMQFGGHVELHENPWQAVQRELREESGYDIDQLQLLQPPYRYLNKLSTVTLHPQPVCLLTYPAGNDHYHTDICYAFVAHEAPRHDIAEGESNAIELLNQEQFGSLDNKELCGNVREVGMYIFETVLPEWQAVPMRWTESASQSFVDSSK